MKHIVTNAGTIYGINFKYVLFFTIDGTEKESDQEVNIFFNHETHQNNRYGNSLQFEGEEAKPIARMLLNLKSLP